MALAKPYRRIAALAQDELRVVRKLAPRKTLSREEQRLLDRALRGLTLKTGDYLHRYRSQQASSFGDSLQRFEARFGHVSPSIEKLGERDFRTVTNCVGSSVALSMVLGALLASESRVGTLVLPNHLVATIRAGGKTWVLDRSAGPVELSKYKKSVWSPPLFKRSFFKSIRSSMGLGTAAHPGAAFEHFFRHVEGDVSLAYAYLNLGIESSEHGDWKRAASLFEKAAQIDPGDPMIHTQLGKAYLALSNAPETFHHLQLAVGLNPYYSRGHFLLAKALFCAGDRRGAIDSLKKAIEISPKDPDLHYTISNLYGEAGRERNRKRHLEITVKLDRGSGKPGVASGKRGQP